MGVQICDIVASDVCLYRLCTGEAVSSEQWHGFACSSQEILMLAVVLSQQLKDSLAMLFIKLNAHTDTVSFPSYVIILVICFLHYFLQKSFREIAAVMILLSCLISLSPCFFICILMLFFLSFHRSQFELLLLSINFMNGVNIVIIHNKSLYCLLLISCLLKWQYKRNLVCR